MFYRNLWIWAALLCAFLSCSDAPKTNGNDPTSTENAAEKFVAGKQISIFMGEDVSPSMKKTGLQLNSVSLSKLLGTINSKNCFGQVCFMLIGDNGGAFYESLRLKKLDTIPQGGMLVTIAKIKAANKIIVQENRAATDIFLEKCKNALQKVTGKTKFTDINGFLKQAKTVFEAPGFENADKILFINSDGEQDANGSKTVNQTLFPPAPVKIHCSNWNKSKGGTVAGASFYGQPEHAIEAIISNILN
jgi:hypothetical protein